MTKAMILAAGQGTRVKPLTKQVPKPMVPILGKPVLEYLIEHLVSHGVRQIMINVAFNHYKIENYFGDGQRWGVEIGYSYEGVRDHGDIVPKPVGSAGGMRKIQDFGGFFDDTTVVTLDVPRDQVKNYGVVVTDDEGRVQSFQEKPKPEEALSTLASTGIYLFEPSVIDLIPPGIEFDIGGQLFPLLVERKAPFFAQSRPFHWIDIGRLSDYWEVLQRVLSGEVPQMKMPGTEVRPGVWVGLNTSVEWDSVHITGPVYIGSGVRIEPGVSIIGPAWIGHGSHLRAGARVERTVLFEYTRVGERQVFCEKILSPQYCVDRSGDAVFVGDDECDLRWGDARGG